MLWHEQSWTRLDQFSRDTPVVVPLGACEQHGPHLPVFVDTIQVQEVARRVEEKLHERILLCPTLWLGSSHHHKDYPGTISLRPTLYTQVIQSLATSILTAGFRRILFLNGHGGNETPASQALADLVATDDQADDAYLTLSSWWTLGHDALSPTNVRLETPGLVSPYLLHACEVETSLILLLRPELVAKTIADQGPPALRAASYSFEYGGRVGVYRRFHRQTATGAMGCPSLATAQKGRAILDSVVGHVVTFLEEFATWPALPRLGPKAAP